MERKNDLPELNALLGDVFLDLSLLDEARTHKTYTQYVSSDTVRCYESLEWLGDRVLALAVSEHLMRIRPELSVRQKDDLASELTKNHTLWLIGLYLGIGPYIRMADPNDGPQFGVSREKDVADVMEAIIGGIHQQRGYHAAASFVRRTVLQLLDSDSTFNALPKPIAELGRCTRSHFGDTPEYFQWETQGEERELGACVCQVIIDDHYSYIGRGPTEEESKIDAARRALADFFNYRPVRLS